MGTLSSCVPTPCILMPRRDRHCRPSSPSPVCAGEQGQRELGPPDSWVPSRVSASGPNLGPGHPHPRALGDGLVPRSRHVKCTSSHLQESHWASARGPPLLLVAKHGWAFRGPTGLRPRGPPRNLPIRGRPSGRREKATRSPRLGGSQGRPITGSVGHAGPGQPLPPAACGQGCGRVRAEPVKGPGAGLPTGGPWGACLLVLRAQRPSSQRGRLGQ